MRTETAGYAAVRARRYTQPRYYVRFFHVPIYGSAAEYAFGTDFSTGTVLDAALGKLPIIERIDGATAQVFPEQGRATVGNISITLNNAQNLALYYLGRLRAPLGMDMTATFPGPGEDLIFAQTIYNMPAGGTLEIATNEVIERIRYSGLGLPSDRVTVVARGVDGTVAAAHAIGDEATNGEQIRPGQRAQIYAGYANIPESQYMPFMKMEVVNRTQHDNGQAFVVELADIQRTLRRNVFLDATDTNPAILIGAPLELMLHMLASTGTGTNGIYDDWPATWGLSIPQAYIDITAIQTLTAILAAPQFEFDIRAPEAAKEWIEREILLPCNCYPYVTQEGKYSLRRLGGLPA